jgi:transcriptional regulator
MEVSPEILEKAKKVEELIAEWENALESKDMEKLKKIAYEILKMGDEFMKKIWKDITPGEKISDVAKKVLEQKENT